MSLLDELNPACPRGCGRTMDDCYESEDGGECEGGELLRENQRLTSELARVEGLLDASLTKRDKLSNELREVRASAAQLRGELAEAKRQRDIAERELFDANRKLGNLRGVRIWTNEDDKRFAFADDLAVALEWTAPSQAVVSEAVAHAATVGTQLAEIEMRVAADKAVLEAADVWRDAVRQAGTVYRLEGPAGELLAAIDARNGLLATLPGAGNPGRSGQESTADGPHPCETCPPECDCTADGPEQTEEPAQAVDVRDCGCIYGPGRQIQVCGTRHQVINFASIEVLP